MANVTLSMNHVLSIIHSMPLTPSNKRWLGERLIDEAKAECRAEQKSAQKPAITMDDLTIAPQVTRMFRNVPSMSAEYDIKKEYVDYLCEKYQ